MAGSARNPAPIDSRQRTRPPNPTVTRSDPASAASGGLTSPPVAVRVCQATEMAAAMRLVSVPESEKEGAARRLLAAGPRHGVDFSHAWVVLDPQSSGAPIVRQVCLAVPGAGRTGMVFLSEPGPSGDPGGSAGGLQDRTACLEAACSDMQTLRQDDGRPRVAIVQALPEPRESWTIDACTTSGFIHVGNLTYMRAAVPPLRKLGEARAEGWPGGIEVVSASSIPAARRAEVLVEALDSSYEQTLDCPELCGLRETEDILESHRSTGVHDPALWWVVFEDHRPRGTILLSRCPEQQAVELVYLGLAPSLRGRGLARRLMDQGFRATASARLGEMTCAVDERNTPAVKLYKSCGFRAFSQRVAMVRPL